MLEHMHTIIHTMKIKSLGPGPILLLSMKKGLYGCKHVVCCMAYSYLIIIVTLILVTYRCAAWQCMRHHITIYYILYMQRIHFPV
jgi:hypothetical protein